MRWRQKQKQVSRSPGVERPFVAAAMGVQPLLISLITYDLLGRDEPVFIEARRAVAHGVSAISGSLGAPIAEGTAIAVTEFAVYSIFAAIVAGGAVALAGWRSSEQVRELINGANRMRAGERGIKIGSVVDNSLGELADSINGMVKALSGSEQALREAVKAQGAVLDGAPVALVTLDGDQTIVGWNKVAEAVFGFSAEDVMGRSFWTMLPDEEVESLHKVLRENADGGAIFGETCKQLRKDGSIARVRRSSSPLRRPDWQKPGTVLALEKLPERRNEVTTVAHPLTQDALTGLSNAESFRGSVASALTRSRRQSAILAVHCVSIERVNALGAMRGRNTGDVLLQAVADRLCDLVREGELIGRLGGNEFAILQTQIKDRQDVVGLARRMMRDLAKPYSIEGHDVAMRVRMGIAIAPEHGGDADALIKKAGIALDRARLDRSDDARLFEPRMHEEMETRRELERDLAGALRNGELMPYYQPIVELEHGNVVGCEALLRWNHPRRGFVSPVEFIPIAEETGLITPIGEWMLRQACADAIQWPLRMKVAVNLSPVQFRSANLVPTVVSALASSGLAPDRLELEITESVLMEDSTENLELLHKLRRLGVRIAMDDFGTGYSSLGYLRSFPLHKIKIDRTFVKNLPRSAESLAIVRAVTGLAESFGLTTTAEGIETEQQLRQIRSQGVTEGQGFLFSKPIPAREVHGFLVGASIAAKRSA